MTKERYILYEGKSGKFSEIDAFLNDIAEVCKKHSMAISHEDRHGAFVIERYSEDNLKWLSYAHNNVRNPKLEPEM